MMAERQEDRVVEAETAMDRSAEDMQERVDSLDAQVSETRADWERTKRSEAVPTAAGDWEDTEDDAGGDDAAAFDDPEEEVDEGELDEDES